MIERATGDASAARDGLDISVGVAVAGEQLARGLDERGAGRLGLLELAALDCHTGLMSDTYCWYAKCRPKPITTGGRLAMKAAEFHQARKFAETASGRIAYVESGTGPAALFVHGFPLNGFAWRGALEDLAATRRCIALDLMGLGYTEVGVEQNLEFDQQAAMIAGFLDRLGLSQVDLIGNDTGAGIS